MGPIPVSKATIHARIKDAKNAGIRVLLYFADGLNTCTGVDFYADQCVLSNYHEPLWTGPDTLGTVHILNPLSEKTRNQYKMYLTALLDEYGAEIDGFVWDETYQLGTTHFS